MSTKPIGFLDNLAAFLRAAFSTFALTSMTTWKVLLTPFLAFQHHGISVTSYQHSVTTDWQLFLNLYFTVLLTDLPATLWARMVTSCPFLFTGFLTAKFHVISVRRMTCQRARMTAFQAHRTWSLTPSHGNFCIKIFCCFNTDFIVVDLTNDGQEVSNTATSFQICNNLLPNVTVFWEKSKISNAVETFSCTRKSNACAVNNLDESDFLIFVTAHERQKDDVVFFTLEVVNCCHTHTSEGWIVFRFKGFLDGIFFLKAVSDGVHLSRVGCQQGNLIGFVSLLH